MKNQDHYRKTLRYVEALAGGPAQLARLLEADAHLLGSWYSGTQPIPEAIFLRLVDGVLGASKKDVERSRSYQHRTPPDC